MGEKIESFWRNSQIENVSLPDFPISNDSKVSVEAPALIDAGFSTKPIHRKLSLSFDLDFGSLSDVKKEAGSQDKVRML